MKKLLMTICSLCMLLLLTGTFKSSVFADAAVAEDPATNPDYFGPITRETINFTITYIADESMTVGSNRVAVYGEYGARERWVSDSGEIWYTRKEPVHQVVYVGTKSTQVTTYTDYKTIYKADETVTAGEVSQVQEGRLGTRLVETFYSLDEKTGEVSPKEEKVTVVDVLDQVYKVGTKPQSISKSVDFATDYIKDNTLEEGKEIVKEEGAKGKESHTITFSVNENTGEVSPTTESSFVPPKNRVILVGTKKVAIKEGKIPTLPKGKEELKKKEEPKKEQEIKIDKKEKNIGPIEDKSVKKKMVSKSKPAPKTLDESKSTDYSLLLFFSLAFIIGIFGRKTICRKN